MYASGEDAFTIDQSLRFEDGDVPELLFTPSSTGNRKTWTMSLWAKRGSFSSTHQVIFEARDGDSGSSDNIKWENEQLCVILQDGTLGRLKSTAAFRDVSAWYHIVVAVDTTQATNTNRIKVYVNGTQLTSFTGTNTYPSEDDDTRVNWSSSDHQFGNARNPDNDHGLHGYLAEVHHIDGTALTPTSFGETGDYGEWKPKEVSGLTYGTNGFYLSFAGGGVMSATGGNSTATDGDYKAASFTSNGTFTPSADGFVEYLVIGGGGGGGQGGGGGGAGGYRTGYLAVTGSTAYSITVGTGGASPTSTAGGTNGVDSIFSSITSDGGGGGGTDSGGSTKDGGSGGGEGREESGDGGGAATAGQGYNGGEGANYSQGGGGGASAVGSNATAGTGSGSGGNGGAGLASSITGASVTRAAGGGGGSYQGTVGSGGSSIGGNGGNDSQAATTPTANTGSGGGGGGVAGSYTSGTAGADGIVILRYKFQ